MKKAVKSKDNGAARRGKRKGRGMGKSKPVAMAVKASSAVVPGSLPLPNTREERFCQLYCGRHWANATLSYLEAGYTTEEVRTAQSSGSVLLSKPIVKARVAYLREQDAIGLDLERKDCARRLRAIAVAKIGDYLDEHGEPILHPHSETEAVAEIEIKRDGQTGVITSKRIKLKDDVAAYKLLGLCESEKADHNIGGGLTIVILTPEQAAARQAEQLKQLGPLPAPIVIPFSGGQRPAGGK